jgi:hypothetical protein
MRRIALEIFKKSRVDSIAVLMSHPTMKDALNALPPKSNTPKRPSPATVLKEKVDAVSEAFNGMNPEVAHLILNTLSGLTDVQLKAVAQKKVLSKVTGSIGNLNPTPEQVGGTKDAEADKPMPQQVYDTEDEEPDEPMPEQVCDTVGNDDGSVVQSNTSQERLSGKRVTTDSSDEPQDASTGASQQAESNISVNKKPKRSRSKTEQSLERLCQEQQNTTDILRSTAEAQQKQIHYLINLVRRCAESLESFQRK